jgi:exopolyphosphatase/guanosine-5'-triphosphate,3'-diphosphate pyrophosphatase
MPHSQLPKKTIAAIDIGTNSAHMVIAEMDHVGEMRILDNDKVNLRLGKAIGPDGNLSEDGIQRTVEALAHMQEIIRPFQATVRAVATHATREARNHRRLLREVERTSGIKIEIIDGIEEARLVFLGMRYGLALNNVPCLGVDVGGGSTEMIVAKDDEIRFVSSVKLGAVTLTDRFFKNAYSGSAFEALKGHVHSRLAPLEQEMSGLSFDRTLASSGTAKAIAFLHAKLFGNSAMSDPNGYILPRDDLFKLGSLFASLMTPQKIREATGLDHSRAEIILAGTAILEELTRLLNVKEWVITSFGLREGLVADTFYRATDAPAGELPDIQWHSVLQFARRLGLNQVHAAKVKLLALRLYHQLAPLCLKAPSADAADADIKTLKASAYLREAGKFISNPQYHRHSQYLISNSRLPGFTESERQLTGLIARFQRKGLPNADHPDCADLTASDLKRLKFLAGILRLAAALDRTRQSRVEDIELDTSGPGVKLTLIYKPDRPPDVELLKARLEQSALEKSWDLDLSFHTRPAISTGSI